MAEKESIVKIIVKPCPNCGGTRFKYNPPKTRQEYKGEVIKGKYTCDNCNAQLN